MPAKVGICPNLTGSMLLERVEINDHATLALRDLIRHVGRSHLTPRWRELSVPGERGAPVLSLVCRLKPHLGRKGAGQFVGFGESHARPVLMLSIAAIELSP